MLYHWVFICSVRYRYDTYRQKMEQHYKALEEEGRPPLTEAQKARKLIASDAKALQEIRYYQRGTENLVPKAAMVR